MSVETKQLVMQSRLGDEPSMRQLIDQYSARVFALCFRMLGHRQDAEDAAQETFVRMFRSLHTWDSDREFEPWLLAIAGNRCRTRISRISKRPKSIGLDEPELAKADPTDEGVRHIEEEIEQALKGVTPRYSQAFLHFHQQGMSYAQIADVMEVPMGTVKTWVRRARLQLVGQLKSRGVIEESHHELRDI